MSKHNYGLGKTYTSASEAFRDADYATPLWKCETDTDRGIKYLGWIAMWVAVLGGLFFLATGFEALMK